MNQDLIGYDDIIENSMRLVIYEALKKIEKTGLPGKHYFVVTFAIKYPGVVMPKSLKEKFGDEMTVAIQYQYRDLAVEQDKFKISLSFDGQFEKLEVPYKSVVSFSDPSINFALKFSNYEEMDEQEKLYDEHQANSNSSDSTNQPNIDLSAKVVSLDAFRKNKNKDSDS